MNFYEVTFTCYLFKNIHFQYANEKISKNINKSMLLDEMLSGQHEENKYKFFCFNSFYPIEKDKIYKAGRIYVFRIRGINENYVKKLKIVIDKNKNEDFKIVSSDIKCISRRHISEIYTITPVVITTEGNHNWLSSDGFNILINRLHSNLEKKYNSFYKQNVRAMDNFIQHLNMINYKPFSFKYKNTKLLGNKFKIIPNDDEFSQKLAFMALATGLGEKSSSMGMGYCNYRFL